MSKVTENTVIKNIFKNIDSQGTNLRQEMEVYVHVQRLVNIACFNKDGLVNRNNRSAMCIIRSTIILLTNTKWCLLDYLPLL